MLAEANNLHSARVVSVDTGGVSLEGGLDMPRDALGVALFAHGSGSSRHSPRNLFVADSLNERRIGTLLIDLLTSEEERVDQFTRQLRFDIALLADRLAGAIEWLRNEPETAPLPLGLFGASTGSAAALIAAARKPDEVSAVVSRGGRPDLAERYLPDVKAPTLLIVGGNDLTVLELNRRAQRDLRAPSELRVVEGASHLFEEPGALEQVAKLAGDWFAKRLGV